MTTAGRRKEPGVPELRNRPGQPDGPAEPYARDAPRQRSDLQQRLDRLPPGHPSSPRNADLGRTEQAPVSREPSPDRHEPAADEPDRDGPDHQPDAAHGDYWSEVPRFLRAWAAHEQKWPAERAAVAVDRSRDPAGSWRGDGNQYLSPEQHAQATEVIAEVREAEEKLTSGMEEVERENACGGWLAGKEFRLKGEERLKEKIAEKIEHEPGRAPAQTIRQINDVIRYTFCFYPEEYSDGYQDVAKRLAARECQLIYCKNHWRDDAEYKGINTRWVTKEGQRFEVQFHTAESFHAKQYITHRSYERLRSPLTIDDERPGLRSFQREVSSWIAAPEGVYAIADYRQKGHV